MNAVHFEGASLSDIEEFWLSVGAGIKDRYPINGVPDDIAHAYSALLLRAMDLVKDGEVFLKMLREKGDISD